MLHGAQKPVVVYQNLLQRSVRAGDKVLDPFAGTGPQKMIRLITIMLLAAATLSDTAEFKDLVMVATVFVLAMSFHLDQWY